MSRRSGQRTSAAEVERRATQVYKMMRSGVQREEMLRIGNETLNWDVSLRSLNLYIQRARERFERDADVIRKAELGKAIARLDHLYLETETRGDFRGALMIEAKRIDTLGLSLSSDHDSDAMAVVDEWLTALKGEGEP